MFREMDAAATRHETPCGDGTMVWRVWNAGAGSPLVFLHGGNGSWRHWVRNIGAFARDRCVIAPDLPGLGESALPPDAHDTGSVARMVAEGLPQVAEAPVDLVGFSFGANIGGQAASLLGPRVRSLMIVGAGSLGTARGDTPLEKIRDKEGEARIAAHRRNLAALMIADPDKIDDDALAIQEWNTVHARFRSRGFATANQLGEALTRVAAPVAALWGGRDQVAAATLEARIATVRAAHPAAPVTLIPDAGHWVAYEAPDAFNAALTGWLIRAA
jgi:pimeloyl-ACP methyl ester carboxylesterase